MSTTASTQPHATRAPLSQLGPIDQLRAGRLVRRLPQLFLGLLLYGASLAMMARAGLGMAPWDVLHSGFVRHVPITLGQAVILFSLVVLLAWIPLRERPGLGTLANALLIGLAADGTLAVLDHPDALALQIGLMIGGVLLNGLATALYIGAQFGRGPRDGLMTGLHRRTGRSLRVVRTVLELTVLAIGFALGGALGVGTVLYAVAIGPITQAALPRLTVDLRAAEAGGSANAGRHGGQIPGPFEASDSSDP